MREPSLSLVMIVKNEAHNLYTCLSRVKDAVDEIVIVDTGSTDNTLEVAEKFTSSIYHFKWNRNFSSARNFSLDKATGDWILVLDGDEIIDNPFYMRELIKNSDSTAYEFERFTYLTMDFSPEFRVDKVIKLFPNFKKIRFSGNVRETPVIPDDTNFKVISSGIKIWHYGYVDKSFPAGKKYERDLWLHLENLEKSPKDGLENFYAGLNYYYLYKYEKSREYLELAVKYADRTGPYYAAFLSILGAVLNRLKCYKEAVETCKKSLAINPSSGEAYFNSGEGEKNLGHYEEAIIYLKKAIENNEGDFSFQDRAKSSWKAWYEMALCYSKMKDYEKSRDAFLMALNLKPLYPLILSALGYVYLQLKDRESSEICFYKAFEQEYKSFEMAYELYKIYIKKKKFHMAGKILEELYLNHKGRKAELIKDMAEAFRLSEDYDKAIEYYNVYIKNNPEENEPYLYRGVCFFRKGFIKKAKKDFERAMKKEPHILRTVFLEELMCSK